MILVTGGAGYIGSHCALTLLEKGNPVVVLDNLSTGHIETIEKLKEAGDLKFYQADLLEPKSIEKVFSENQIDEVIHFAGVALVPESVVNPQKYYMNNVVGTLNLLNTMLKFGTKRIVFSSTCATYGEPQYIPIDENHIQNPINPYGQSKLMIEKILDDYDKAYGIKSVRLRYFNVTGADKKSRIGEWHQIETHLIPNILKSTLDTSKTFEIYGDDYDTKDGTCVRDYIDMEDLINAHVLALEYLRNGGKTDYFNIGTHNGSSVKDIFEECKAVTKCDIPVKICARRPGDPAKLIADNQKASEILKWNPKNTLQNSIQNAYNWEKVLSNIHNK